MMRFFLAVSAILSAASAAGTSNGLTIPVQVLEDASIPSATTTLMAKTHYDPPPCAFQDEKAVRIMGVDGEYCAPACDPSGGCTSDVPSGVTATPLCALQSPTGDKFCAILCSPSDDSNKNLRGGGECGPMECQQVPGQKGVGICTYVSDEDLVAME